MNITVIRLVIIATSTGFVVMCKILTVVVASRFLNAHVNSTFLGRDSLPLILILYIYIYIYIYMYAYVQNFVCLC